MNGACAPADFAPAVTPDEFADLMRAAGPFPRSPHVAVGVSGGGDSMTLLMLARDWVKASGGTLTALTVDHGLRPESGDEAGGVGSWCAELGVTHRTLVWEGDKPDTGIQADAREARYSLLTGWCRDNQFTELLVGHTENDQAETFLLRMGRGSGIDGLAAMPLVSHLDGVRLIRPLLSVSRARIDATVGKNMLPTVADPGNADRRYTRVRLRDAVARLESEGVSAHTIAGTARVFGALRHARETETGRLAKEIADIHPEGFAEIDHAGLSAAEGEIARGLISAVIGAVGGGRYPPRRERLDRLMAVLADGAAFRPRTLGNCVVSQRQDRVSIRREHRNISDVEPVIPGKSVFWDRRFHIRFAQIPSTGGVPLELRVLGEHGWQTIAADAQSPENHRIPGPVRYALPAIWQDNEVVEVPHLGYRAKQIVDIIVESAQFRRQPVLAALPFWVA